MKNGKIETSTFLSKAMGLYFLVVSTAMLLNITQFSDNVIKLVNDSSLLFVVGFFTLIIGIVLILSHNVWQWNWRLLITVLCWLTFLKGTAILLYPKYLDQVSFIFIEHHVFAYSAAIIDFILGLLLCYLGLKYQKFQH